MSVLEAGQRLRKLVNGCVNCGGSNRIGVLQIGGVGIEECHVCRELREILKLLGFVGKEADTK